MDKKATAKRLAFQALKNPLIFKLNVLRDQQSLATWLLLGEIVKSLLLYLPFHSRYIVAPTLVLALVKLARGIVAVSS